MKNNSTSVLNNMFWKFAERFSTQAASLIVSVVLARILDPNSYGLIATVTIFISIANVFVTDGFSSALIQRKSVDCLDYSSVLNFNIIFSMFLYVILFICAPAIGNYYGEGYELVTPVLRVLGVRLVINSINSIQQAYLSRNMLFKKAFAPTFIGTVLSGVIGIILANCGFGVWALVAQNLSNSFISTVILQIIIHKYPGIRISFYRLQNLLAFGFKILLTGLLMSGFEQIRAFLIGKKYTSADLAYYDRGNQFPSVLINNVNSTISAVMFPKLSQLQDSKSELKDLMKKSIRFSSFILFPLMFGLAAISETLVLVLLTDKWIACVPLLQLFCLYYIFMPIHSANMQVIKALGRSDIYMRLECIKKAIELVVLIVTIRISVKWMVVGMVACSILFVFVNAYPNKKLLNYSIKEQISDISPSIGMSIVMFLPVYAINYIPMNNILKLVLQVIVGLAFYFIISIVTKNSEFMYAKELVLGKSKLFLKVK